MIDSLSSEEKEAFYGIKRELYPITDDEALNILNTVKELAKAGE
ncbi:hypothetical protein [Metabacillus sp. Hm71]